MEHLEREGKQVPGHEKEITIYINSTPTPFTGKEISFEKVIELAFGAMSPDPNVIYTVTYERGEGNKPEGTMVKGQSVKVKEGMQFDATDTGRS